MTGHDGYGDRWFDREAGPVVRPYALTMGRTRPAGGASFDLIDVVIAASDRMPEHFRPGPEHRRLLSLCHRPTPIVDLTSEILQVTGQRQDRARDVVGKPPQQQLGFARIDRD